MEPHTVEGCQKVATLLLALDPEVASDLLARFEEAQRAEIVEAMLSIDYVDDATAQGVLEEFERACGVEVHAVPEPKARVRGMLAKALGEEDVDAYMREHNPVDDTDPYTILDRVPTRHLVTLLANEHPQTIAIVLSRISAGTAGEVLSALPDSVSAEVVNRIVSCEQSAPPAVIDRIGHVLAERVRVLTSSVDPWATQESRFRLVADVLAAAKQSSRDAALETVRAKDPGLGERVRDLMFLFDDLSCLKTTDLRKVTGALDSQVIALAMKTAGDELKRAIFGAMSKRAAATLQEEIELLGPRPLSEVEDAHRKVVAAVMRLQEEGELVVQRGAVEELV